MLIQICACFPILYLYRLRFNISKSFIVGFIKLRKIEILQKRGTPQFCTRNEARKVKSFIKNNNEKSSSNIAIMRKQNDQYSKKGSEKKLVSIIKNNVTESVQNSSQKETEPDYGYTTVSALTTPKPLIDLMGIESYHRPYVDSEYCLTQVEVKKILSQNITDVTNLDEIKPLYETKEYLNSVAFGEQFAKIFSSRLSKPLGYRIDTLDKAMTRLDAAAIFCNQSAIAHEIIPSVSTKWPYCAEEWLTRQRQQPVSHRDQIWPTISMINHVHSLDCQLLPCGYIAKRGANAERHLEWRATFPEAERYLLSTLHHSEVRCYEFILLLFRKLLEPTISEMEGISSYIRAHFFWQCEMKVGVWRDDRLGEIILDILRTFYRRLQKKRLPDYFVRDRNMFESIPTERLNLIAAQVHSAIERPTMHFIATLVHLQYRDRNFYPMIDLQKLYTILTNEDIILLLNPNMARDYRADRQKFNTDIQEINDLEEVESSITALKGAVVQNSEDQNQIWSRQARKLIEVAKERTRINEEWSKKNQDIINLQVFNIVI